MARITAAHALIAPSATGGAVREQDLDRTMVQCTPLVVTLPLLALWAWMFRDVARNDSLPDIAKQQWLLAFSLVNIVAAIFSYFGEDRDRA